MGRYEHTDTSALEIARLPNASDVARWIKDTKAVDPSGSPEIFFHGSYAQSPFIGMGTHFGTYHAAGYRLVGLALASGIRTPKLEFQDGYIYPGLLKMNNPIRVSDCWGDGNIGAGAETIAREHPALIGGKELEWIREPLHFNRILQAPGIVFPMPLAKAEAEIVQKGSMPMPKVDMYLDPADRAFQRDDLARETVATMRLIETLQRKGVDGVFYDNYEEHGVSWVAFRPEQCVLLPFRLKYSEDHSRRYKLPEAMKPLTQIREVASESVTEKVSRVYKAAVEKLGL